MFSLLWFLSLQVLASFISITAKVNKSYITSECYGSVLSLSCKPGHRIKVLDDFFGVSERIRGPTLCRFEPGDCTVTNSRFTSVIHRYCEGKQSCTTFQVDRRFCGNNQTNYEQVEYVCVPDEEITDICSDMAYTAEAGYISTPNFPSEYPVNMDCSCSLHTNQPNSRIKLEATHFIVKFDNPCRDWLEIDVQGHKRRLCGAYRSTLRSPDFNLTFHSDDKDGHQGVWLYFTVDPPQANATLTVECGTKQMQPTTTSTTVAPTITTPAEEEVVILSNNKSKLIDETNDTISSKSIYESMKRNKTRPGKGEQIDIIDDSGHVSELTTTNKANPTNSPVSKSKSKPNKETSTNSLANSQMKNKPSTLSTGEKNNGSNKSESLSDDNSASDSEADRLARQRNRTTGIIIISICVGGILLLVTILGVLLCLNKKRRPKRVAERERKKRLQQRLNSLSFYDSIPLYDSIGRKGGGQMSHILQLPPPPPPPGTEQPEPGHSQAQAPADPTAAATSDKTNSLDCNKDTPQTLDPKTLPYKAWSPSPEMGETEVDSAIYTELGKHWRGTSDNKTPSGEVATPSTKDSNTPNGEGPPGYSLHLKSPDSNSEDIYTHV